MLIPDPQASLADSTPIAEPLPLASAKPLVKAQPLPGKQDALTQAKATVRLGAVRRNYKKIIKQAGHSQVAVAVKADGYGLGASAVAKSLWAAGCVEFFVAHAEEGIAIRKTLPGAAINVLNGVMPGTECEMLEYNLTPTIINVQQLQLWQRQAYKLGREVTCGLHLDTGMHRTGLPVNEIALIQQQPERLNGLHINHIISHLASADDPDSEQPEQQLRRFRSALRQLPAARASIANSAGIFRDNQFHLDLVRPGIAVYGGNPQPIGANPMEPAVVLEAPLLQVVDATQGDLIGYGASYKTARTTARHGIIAAGYADGVLRSTSNKGEVAIGNRRCPIIGRVSMDVTTIDVTDVPQHLLYPGAPVELIGDTIKLDDAATAAGTISYEMLTAIGNRYKRHYAED